MFSKKKRNYLIMLTALCIIFTQSNMLTYAENNDISYDDEIVLEDTASEDSELDHDDSINENDIEIIFDEHETETQVSEFDVADSISDPSDFILETPESSEKESFNSEEDDSLNQGNLEQNTGGQNIISDEIESTHGLQNSEASEEEREQEVESNKVNHNQILEELDTESEIAEEMDSEDVNLLIVGQAIAVKDRIYENEEKIPTFYAAPTVTAKSYSDAALKARTQLKKGYATVNVNLNFDTSKDQDPGALLKKELFKEVSNDGTSGAYMNRLYMDSKVSVSGKKFVVKFIPTFYKQTFADEKRMTSELESWYSKSGVKSKTNSQKIQLINDYICNKATYDRTQNQKLIEMYQAPFTIFQTSGSYKGKSVCAGYSILFYRMARDCGLDVKYVMGQVYGGSWINHAWNLVPLDNQYYYIDVMYNDFSYNYRSHFMKGSQTFSKNYRNEDWCGIPKPERFKERLNKYDLKCLSGHAYTGTNTGKVKFYSEKEAWAFFTCKNCKQQTGCKKCSLSSKTIKTATVKAKGQKQITATAKLKSATATGSKKYDIPILIAKYTVKYLANGGSGSMANTSHQWGVTSATRKNTFTRTGYTFKGWYIQRENGAWKCSKKNSDGKKVWKEYTDLNQAKKDGYTQNLYSDGVKITKETEKNGEVIKFHAQWELINPLKNTKVPNLNATPAGRKKVRISWDHVSKADYYVIMATKGNQHMKVGATTNNYFVDTAADDSSYNFYWVYPGYKDNETGKAYSGVCPDYVYAKGILPAVNNLIGSNSTRGAYLTWDYMPEADGYLVYGYSNGSKTYGYIGHTLSNKFYDSKASDSIYSYYWVYPYYWKSGIRVIGEKPAYVYGKTKV